MSQCPFGKVYITNVLVLDMVQQMLKYAELFSSHVVDIVNALLCVGTTAVKVTLLY